MDLPSTPAPAPARATLQHTVVTVGLRLQEWHPFFNESSVPQIQELGQLRLASLATHMQNCGQGLGVLSLNSLGETITSTWQQGQRKSAEKSEPRSRCHMANPQPRKSHGHPQLGQHRVQKHEGHFKVLTRMGRAKNLGLQSLRK